MAERKTLMLRKQISRKGLYSWLIVIFILGTSFGVYISYTAKSDDIDTCIEYYNLCVYELNNCLARCDPLNMVDLQLPVNITTTEVG